MWIIGSHHDAFKRFVFWVFLFFWCWACILQTKCRWNCLWARKHFSLHLLTDIKRLPTLFTWAKYNNCNWSYTRRVNSTHEMHANQNVSNMWCWVYHLIKWKRSVSAISVESQHFHINSNDSSSFFSFLFYSDNLLYCGVSFVFVIFFAYIYRSVIKMMTTTTTMTYFHPFGNCMLNLIYSETRGFSVQACIESQKNNKKVCNFIMFWNK